MQQNDLGKWPEMASRELAGDSLSLIGDLKARRRRGIWACLERKIEKDKVQLAETMVPRYSVRVWKRWPTNLKTGLGEDLAKE